MRFADLQKICCVGCGQQHDLHSIGAMNANLRGCPACIAKHGNTVLALQADEIIATATHGPGGVGTCRHCNEPVIANADGAIPLICTACEAEWRAIR